MHATNFENMISRFRRVFSTAAAVALLISTPAGASLIVTVGNVSSVSPSSSNTLEVNLINTGPASLSLGGFSFELAVADPDITFTSATIDTVAGYVFAGNSLLGPVISTSAAGQTLDASDFWSGAGGAVVAAGATVGLGHVFFDVLAGDSPGLVPITLSPATSLSDPEGGNIIIETLRNGSITIAGSPVPEPPALTLALLGLVVLAWARGAMAPVRASASLHRL